MIVPRSLREGDLAPGDLRSRSFDWAGWQFLEVNHPDDPDFERIYTAMELEFGGRHELETREILRQRLAWSKMETQKHQLRYHMLGLVKEGRLAAVRDHSIIAKRHPSPQLWVHLSHVWVAPEWRRTGLAGWLRSFPVGDAARFSRELDFPSETRLTLIAEMEPLENPEQLPRLKAYANAGFRRVDPAQVAYSQPDFRPFAEIDRSGGPQPLHFWLMLRQVGHEMSGSISGEEIVSLVSALYAMYASGFRRKDLELLYADLGNYPAADASIALQDLANFLE